MNGYSKINNSSDSTHKPRSIDFSDFFSFPQTRKKLMIRNTSPVIKRTEDPTQIKESKAQNSSTAQRKREKEEGDEEKDETGERFGVVLGRCASVSSASASSCSSSASGIQAMKRAFSLRRSSSVSEGYCRIHDQLMALASPVGDDETFGRRSVKKKQKGGKILRACKRLLGL